MIVAVIVVVFIFDVKGRRCIISHIGSSTSVGQTASATVRGCMFKRNTSGVSSAVLFTLVRCFSSCDTQFISSTASFSSMHAIRCNHSGRSTSQNRVTGCCSLPTNQIASTIPVVVAIAHAYTTRNVTHVKPPTSVTFDVKAPRIGLCCHSCFSATGRELALSTGGQFRRSTTWEITAHCFTFVQCFASRLTKFIGTSTSF